jgi:hypothetical protein
MGAVEASPEVLPDDRRRQLRELPLAQVLPQGVMQIGAMDRGGLGESIGVFEDQSLGE